MIILSIRLETALTTLKNFIPLLMLYEDYTVHDKYLKLPLL